MLVQSLFSNSVLDLIFRCVFLGFYFVSKKSQGSVGEHLGCFAVRLGRSSWFGAQLARYAHDSQRCPNSAGPPNFYFLANACAGHTHVLSRFFPCFCGFGVLVLGVVGFCLSAYHTLLLMRGKSSL